MARSGLLRLLLPLSLLVLAGCAPLKPPPDTTAWESHKRAILDLNQWRLEGKLGYRGPGDNGSARVNWHQQGDAFELLISGPFGAGAARIRGDSSHAVLSQSGREDIEAPDPARLTARIFGWELPVQAMAAWARGVPAPGLEHQQLTFNDRGRLATLSQHGWHLTFEEYGEHDGLVLPGRIRGSDGNVAFTLVIKRWQAEG